ncbi:MAG: hypothetical protein OXG60_20025 [Chloroflexi bacterium]|nr:hypothetical protein [Chloroflexota bacterium]
MSEETTNQHQEIKDNRHGIATAAGIVICIVYGLLARNDLLFGLVMATVYGSGMNAGVRISKKLLEGDQGNALPARVISAVVVGIIGAVIISIVQGIAPVAPAEGDNIIVAIIKHFFDNSAALALGIGALVGSIAHGMASE